MPLRRPRAEGGASAVEFALVIPFLMLLLFGMVTTAFAYSDHLSVTNAVREGARYGAAVDYSTGSWATSVRDRVKQVYFNAGDTVTDAQICVDLVKSNGSTVTATGASWAGTNCGTAPDVPADMTTGSCAVRVWVSKPQSIQLVIAPDLTFDIGAESVAYYGRTVTPDCPAK
jgi:Flp pilus assembly protein TadG